MLKFGIDLITFFDPSFWGVASEADVVALGRAEPRSFWDRMLDTLQATGATGIELTFSPFSWEDTLAAYGSVAAFKSELDRRGLELATGFFADVAIEGDLMSTSKQAEYIRRADLYAEYLAALGAETMVMGLPMRKSWDAEPPMFVDLAMGTAVAGFCNQLGATIRRRGIKLALHTEAHSIFSQARDVDLLMLLTDPVYVGFCPDTAHLVLSGADPVDVVARHLDRVVVTHWKDAIGSMPKDIPIDGDVHLRHRPYFCELGRGRVDWQRWMRLLRDSSHSGWAIIEIDAAANPGEAVKRSLDYVRTSLLPIYS